MGEYSKKKQVFGLVAWLALSFFVSAVGAIASIQAKTFYASLDQPSWAPPGWLFGPVWSTLFVMMAISVWLVWRTGGRRSNRVELALYVSQLVLNGLWSWLFFAWSQGAFAFVDIVVLWVLILATIVAFWRVKPLAGWLLLPYLLWVSFAAALNFTVWQLNPGILGSLGG